MNRSRYSKEVQQVLRLVSLASRSAPPSCTEDELVAVISKAIAALLKDKTAVETGHIIMVALITAVLATHINVQATLDSFLDEYVKKKENDE